VVTAGGLVFIGATNFDRKFRAVDKKTARLLWQDTLPMAGNTTPVTYQIGNKQFVLIYATGGKGKPDSPSGGIFVAYALEK
jgi:quinoprotein glucose dehydrogenase